jgi:hypothetical protein
MSGRAASNPPVREDRGAGRCRHQGSFSQAEYASKKKQTRRDKLLTEMAPGGGVHDEFHPRGTDAARSRQEPPGAPIAPLIRWNLIELMVHGSARCCSG